MAKAAVGAVAGAALREILASIGRAGERDMFTATHGRNAHRGAIWVLGLLVAARAMQASEASARSVTEAAGHIARFPDRYAPAETSHGGRMCARYGVVGARGEAQAGLPHVIDAGLPALWGARAAGADEACAQLDALMAIMRTLDDTCLLQRGGAEALAFAQGGARVVLAAGGTASVAGRRALLRLDTGLLQRYASPGWLRGPFGGLLVLGPMLRRKVSGWRRFDSIIRLLKESRGACMWVWWDRAILKFCSNLRRMRGHMSW